jgi:multidrug resistance efflux pump
MFQKLNYLLLLVSMMLVGGCSTNAQVSQATPVVSPTASSNTEIHSGGTVIASGEVIPVRYARIGLASPAQIESVELQVGQRVETGQLLIVLVGKADRRAAVAAAELALLEAHQSLDELQENWPMQAAQYQVELSQARDELQKAENRRIWQQKNNRATEDTIEYYEAQLVVADDAVDSARGKYNQHKDKDKHNPERAEARVALEQAEDQRDDIVRILNWYKGEPTDIDQAILDANVAIARATVDEASRQFEKWREGPDSDAIAAAQAGVVYAEAKLEAAQVKLEQCEIRAPFDGIIARLSVTPGDVVVPGGELLVLGDPERMRVETTDLSERDIDRVAIGQPAAVFIEALGIEVAGRVVQISPSATTLGGDVVYTVWLELEDQPPGLLWGMSVEVEIVLE